MLPYQFRNGERNAGLAYREMPSACDSTITRPLNRKTQ